MDYSVFKKWDDKSNCKNKKVTILFAIMLR